MLLTINTKITKSLRNLARAFGTPIFESHAIHAKETTRNKHLLVQVAVAGSGIEKILVEHVLDDVEQVIVEQYAPELAMLIQMGEQVEHILLEILLAVRKAVCARKTLGKSLSIRYASRPAPTCSSLMGNHGATIQETSPRTPSSLFRRCLNRSIIHKRLLSTGQ